MNKEEKQLLRDSNITPTDEIIFDGLGTVSDVYKRFVEELKVQNISLMNWRYYNDGKAWLSKGEYKWTTSRGTNKVKPIFWLSIWEGFFKVSFFFSEKNKDNLLSLSISEETKELIKNIIPNGKTMKFLSVIINVNNNKQLDDIYELIKFRKDNI